MLYQPAIHRTFGFGIDGATDYSHAVRSKKAAQMALAALRARYEEPRPGLLIIHSGLNADEVDEIRRRLDQLENAGRSLTIKL